MEINTALSQYKLGRRLRRAEKNNKIPIISRRMVDRANRIEMVAIESPCKIGNTRQACEPELTLVFLIFYPT